MAPHDGRSGGRRPSVAPRSWIMAALVVLMLTTAAGIGTAIRPPAAHAIICVGIGRVIGISDCFGGGYGHFPPPGDYAPLPEDYAPPPPPPPPTTSTPPPAP